MHCTNCGTLNKANARFCAECGSQLAAVAGGENQPISPTVQVPPTGNTEGRDYVQQGKNIASEFWGFVKQSLSGPMKASREVTSEEKVSGIITHILFALLLPLFSYFTTKAFSNGYIDVPFGTVVMKPAIFLLIYLAIYTAVVLAVAKLMKSDVNYIEVMVRLGVFNVAPTALLLVAVLFSLLSVPVFSFILFGAGIGMFFVSSIAVIFSLKENAEGLDVYYGLIIANIAMFIIFMIIGDSIVGNIINEFQNNLPPFGMY